MKLPLIFNPISGAQGKDPEALLACLPEELRRRVEPVALEAPWNYAPLIERAVAACGPLLVWGGDGTLHHAGRALVEAGCPVALAAIPGGSGNGLARGLRTPLEPAGAVANLLNGRELRIDLPRLDGVPFFNVCGTGFEASIAQAFEARQDRGFLNYAKLCVGLWQRHPEMPVRWDALRPETPEPVTAVGKLRAAWQGTEPSLPSKIWSLCFANLPQYGSGLWIAPQADPTDGILQWVHLKRPGVFDLVAEVPQLFREGGRTALRQEGRILRATLHLDRAMSWHLDGEPAPERDRAELTLEKGAFRMQVTSNCPW
jgi:diacylglycerol kinase family enzyme